VKEPIVLDSTCLIGLERIGRLEILPALFEPVIISPAVDREFAKQAEWLSVEVRFDRSLTSVLQMGLGAGESEAISIAKGLGIRIATDDKQARVAANALGLKVIGTVGILLRAKSAGVIDQIRPMLDGLDENGFHISRSLREEALQIANEG